VASLGSAKRLVVKIGSALLVDRGSGALRNDWLQSLVKDVAWLRDQGTDVVLVSSGSIALGCGVLGLPETELALEQSQAAAAVGQIRLARAYEDAFAPHQITTAQILVTLEDSRNRRRYLNSRATMEQLLALGVVPIVNENDTIATDEIRYGDNDRLAAQVAATVGADQLVLLSDIDGFYSANPQQNPAAKRYDLIKKITPELEAMAGDAGSVLSKGGMKTKLMAAKTAMAAGCAMAICNGFELRALSALQNGANATWFLPQDDPQTARKSWIGAMKPKGSVTIDLGAARALTAGNSLLPAGVTQVTGDFQRGDPLTILAPDNTQIGYGLSRYSSPEAKAVKGQRSAEIEKILGHKPRSALIHRDDMVL
jgi:glutamate 5-kinase